MPRKPDPILAAIAAHREALDEWKPEAAYLWPKTGRQKCKAEYDAGKAAYETATEKLVLTDVLTLAGAHALAVYLGNLQCCGRSDIAPGVYAVETWDLSAGMDRIAECLARLAAKRTTKPRPTAQPLPLAA